MNTFEEAIAAHEQWKTTFEQDVRTGGGGPHVDVVRATVSAAAGTLDTKGVITYRHDHVQVGNRPGVEAVSRECNKLIREHFEQFPGRAKGDGEPLAPSVRTGTPVAGMHLGPRRAEASLFGARRRGSLP